MKKIYLCFFNRINLQNNKFNLGSVVDFVKKLSELAKLNGYELVKTRDIKPGKLNILIEDFKNSDVAYINKIKKENPNTKLILILTEFFNSIDNLDTLNTFHLGKNNKTFYINLFGTIETYLKVRKYFELFRNIMPYWFNFLLKLNLSKIIFPYILYNKFAIARNFLVEHVFKTTLALLFSIHRTIIIFFIIIKNPRSKINKPYLNQLKTDILFYYRYSSLKKLENNFDLIIKAHPNIDPKFIFKEKKISTLYFNPSKIPTFDLINDANINLFEFSGEMSIHRKKLFENLKLRLNLNNINNEIIKKNIKTSLNILNELDLGFLDKDVRPLKKKFIFQLHPKKTEEWNFSSPTRYYRSLEKNIIPLTFLSDKISDQITQSYSIEIDDFNDFLNQFCLNPKKIIEEFIVKIQKMNNFSNKSNNEIFDNIKKLDKI